MPRLGLPLLLLVLAGAAGVFCALRLEVTSDITHFLPDDSDAVTARLLRGVASANFAQRSVLLVGGAEPELLARAGARIAELLERQPEIASVERAIDERAQQQIFDLYFPHRYGLYSEDPETNYAELLSEDGLNVAARSFVGALGGIEGPFVRRIATKDPLLLFPALLGRLNAQRTGSNLLLRDGAFFTQDQRHAVVLVRSRASALDAPAQRSVLASIERAFSAVRAELGRPLTLAKSGVGRYAVHAERAIRADIERVSVISSLIVIGLVLGLLRSFRALILVAVPTVFGGVFALAATLLVFERVHGMTLAFGMTLLGVCSDYPAHLLGHHVLAPAGQAGAATARHIWPAIRLGGLTTIAGMVGLGIAGFPGIRELALFSAVGVLASLIATRYIVPVALGPGGDASSRTRAVAAWLARGIVAIERRRRLSWSLLVVALALCIVGFASLRFQDDLASWVPMPRALRAEDERVSASLMTSPPTLFAVASADTLEAALELNDRIASALAQAVEQRELSGYRSLHALLWPQTLQARNLAALRAAPKVAQRALQAFDRMGVETSQLAPFVRELEQLPPPLQLSALLRSPLSPMADAFVLEGPGQPVILTHLMSTPNRAGLERRLAQVPGARLFDQRASLAATYAAFRTRAFELLAFGVIAVLGMVLVRYRSLRRSLAAVLPAVLASAATLSVLSLCGVSLDLFHVLGVLLVLSMGEDYGVFLVESDGGDDMPATALGIALAAATTVASFGLLAMSEIPALRSLGQVVSIGVLLATVFAPAGLVLLDRKAGFGGS